MTAIANFLDTPVTLPIALLALIAFFFAMDVAIVGVGIWRGRLWRVWSWVLDRTLGAEAVRAGEKQIPFFAYVPMPEGSYLAKITFRPYDYRRRRWFGRRILKAHVVMHDPIPIPPPEPSDTKRNRRRLSEDQAVYSVMVPNAPDITAAALYVRHYALALRANFVFGEDAESKQKRANALAT